MIIPPDFTFEERKLALMIDAMDKRRRLAVTDGDLLTQAEIDAWYKQHAATIRPIRDKIEAAEFDAG
ncbi:hypothetical protein BAMBUS_03010 [Brevundimonas phage vB_BpoS-Bambus]|nr:hypothetical protein BAMBUS_03010 [Brevundimonas phage vB_BpoS-Bambus]